MSDCDSISIWEGSPNANAGFTGATFTLPSGAGSTIAAGNIYRNGYKIQPFTDDIWINENGGNAAPNGAGCFILYAGDCYETTVGAKPTAAIAVYTVNGTIIYFAQW